jgi:hypothetical protein
MLPNTSFDFSWSGAALATLVSAPALGYHYTAPTY